MEQQKESWLSVFNDNTFKEIIGEVENPNDVIILFLLRDRINLEVFKANLLFLEAGMPELYQGDFIPSDSIMQFGSKRRRPSGYPQWFIAAYPDTVKWLGNKIQEDKANLFRITQKDENYFKDDSNFIDEKMTFGVLRNILTNYTNDKNKFECSNSPKKLKTVTGSIMGDSMLPAHMKAMLLINDGDIAKNSDDLLTAIEIYSDAIDLFPTANAYYNRGDSYFRKQLYDNAINDFTSAIELKPDFAEAFLARGAIKYNVLNKKMEGCSDLKKASELGIQVAIDLYNRICK